MPSSFSFIPGKVESITKKLVAYKIQSDKELEVKMKWAVGLVFKIATAKRPMITTEQAKTEGRKKFRDSSGKIKQHRVSDPDASHGVPVAMINGGTLQASIKKEVKMSGGKATGTISATTPYASAIEFGTSKMRARPFMRPALKLNEDIILKKFRLKEK